ncbi:MAG: phosphatidylglycerophosphatase A [Elusimicrobia bacterium]|nr:phosphatidylglycerophosphatase A [Candidatus Liberimonas magnetica]
MKKHVNKVSLREKLKENKIYLNDMVQTAMSMYIYDPKIGSPEQVRKKVRDEFNRVLNDINIASIVYAGLYLEQTGKKGLIPGICKEKFESDPVDLIADEILGQAIAVYIAGTRALFEFERLDKQKPGILKKLPPFMDDIVAGLIAGVIVKVCSA